MTAVPLEVSFSGTITDDGAYGTVDLNSELVPEEREEVEDENVAVDTSKLTWPGYFLHYTCAGGKGALSVIDSMGEWLADFFGITGPKYWYIVQEYERQKAEEEKERMMFERDPSQKLECGEE